jgi:hypothetical protein
MRLANFCFADDRFDVELKNLSADILANSWYANHLSRRALVESDGVSLRDSRAPGLFEYEGLAPDALQRTAKFFERRRIKP